MLRRARTWPQTPQPIDAIWDSTTVLAFAFLRDIAADVGVVSRGCLKTSVVRSEVVRISPAGDQQALAADSVDVARTSGTV